MKIKKEDIKMFVEYNLFSIFDFIVSYNQKNNNKYFEKLISPDFYKNVLDFLKTCPDRTIHYQVKDKQNAEKQEGLLHDVLDRIVKGENIYIWQDYSQPQTQYNKLFLESMVGQDIKELENLFFYCNVQRAKKYNKYNILSVNSSDKIFIRDLNEESTKTISYYTYHLQELNLPLIYQHRDTLIVDKKAMQKKQDRILDNIMNDDDLSLFKSSVLGMILLDKEALQLEQFLMNNSETFYDEEAVKFFKLFSDSIFSKYHSAINKGIENGLKYKDQIVNVDSIEPSSKTLQVDIPAIAKKYKMSKKDVEYYLNNAIEEACEQTNTKYFEIKYSEDKFTFIVYAPEHKIQKLEELFFIMINKEEYFINPYDESILIELEKLTIDKTINNSSFKQQIMKI